MNEEDEEFQRIEREVSMRNKAMEREHHYVRPWQDLTDDEVVRLKLAGRDLEFVSMTALRRFAKDIMAALREKNA